MLPFSVYHNVLLHLHDISGAWRGVVVKALRY